MSTTLTIEEAQANLKDLILHLQPGEEIILTANQQAVARLVGAAPAPSSRLRPGPGLCRGMIAVVADDDEHLQDFGDYMP